MPEYSLDELEKLVPDKRLQILLFGDSVDTMRKINPTAKVSTWCKVEDF